ncbi:MAG: hypothetical protein IT289_13300 [Oligoflexia bacterium]|nr:hypothetical protein [Oligoflexia bacterium]
MSAKLLLLSIALCMGLSSSSFAADIDEKVSQVEAAFADINDDNLLNLDSATKAKFQNATALYLDTVQEVVTSGLVGQRQNQLLNRLNKSMGQAFDSITIPYADVVNADHYIGFGSSRATSPIMEKIMAKLETMVNYVKYLGLSVVRDVLRLPATLPFVGTDTERSREILLAANQIESRLLKVKSTEKPEVRDAYFDAIAGGLESLKESEPLAHGRSNRLVWLTYLGAAVFFAFNPNEMFFEPTTLGPVIYAATEVATLSLLMRSRTLNSGLGFYKKASQLIDGVKSPATFAGTKGLCSRVLEKLKIVKKTK